jgi:MoaA/NifB/PqqE/SkfB family radical SAM enzyme
MTPMQHKKSTIKEFKDPADPERGLSGRLHLLTTWKCNYSCSYCFQNGKRDNHPIITNLDSWFEAFKRLASLGIWKVMITGGEPLVYPRLPELGERIAQAGHVLTLITNLSANSKRLDNFISATEGALSLVSASWHPEHISLEDFVQRVKELRTRLRESTELVASFTVSKENYHLLGTVRDAAEKEKIPFLIRSQRDEFSASNNFKHSIGGLESPWLSYRNTRSWFGANCSAGIDYFAVDSNGYVYKCLSDLDADAEPIGNFLLDFIPLKSPSICSHHTECCLCGNHREFPARSRLR